MESRTIRDRIKRFLNEQNLFTNLLGTVEAKTKLNKEYLLYGLMVTATLAIYLDPTNFLSYLLGIVYPIYASLHSVETGYVSDKTKWNVYWSIFALLGLLEYFHEYLLFWVPLYSLSKSIFLIWLMVPGKTGGTHLLYNDVIRPLMKRCESSTSEVTTTRSQVPSAPEKTD